MHLYDLVKFVGFLIFKICQQWGLRPHTSVPVTQYQIWNPPWKNPGYAHGLFKILMQINHTDMQQVTRLKCTSCSTQGTDLQYSPLLFQGIVKSDAISCMIYRVQAFI